MEIMLENLLKSAMEWWTNFLLPFFRNLGSFLGQNPILVSIFITLLLCVSLIICFKLSQVNKELCRDNQKLLDHKNNLLIDNKKNATKINEFQSSYDKIANEKDGLSKSFETLREANRTFTSENSSLKSTTAQLEKYRNNLLATIQRLEKSEKNLTQTNVKLASDNRFMRNLFQGTSFEFKVYDKITKSVEVFSDIQNIYHNVVFEHNKNKYQLDIVALCQSGTYIIECKDWNGKFEVSSTETWSVGGANCSNPLEQVYQASNQFFGAVLKDKDVSSFVRRILVFNDETQKSDNLSNNYNEVVTDCNELIAHHEKYKSVCSFFGATTFTNLEDYIKANTFDSKKTLDTDTISKISQFLSDHQDYKILWD